MGSNLGSLEFCLKTSPFPVLVVMNFLFTCDFVVFITN